MVTCLAGHRHCAEITWAWRRPVFDLELYAEQLALLREDLRQALQGAG